MDQLWGRETGLAIDNFAISGRPLPPEVIHALAGIKAEAALVNAGIDATTIDGDVAAAIAAAAAEIESGASTTSSRSTSSRRVRARPPT